MALALEVATLLRFAHPPTPMCDEMQWAVVHRDGAAMR